MIIKPIKTRIFKEGEDLFDFITAHIKKIPEESVIVITSKIVALAERRTVTKENSSTKEKLIKRESEIAIPSKYVWLTVLQGTIMASAGIDESNANGKFILLPKDSFKTAGLLRKKLMRKFRLRKLGVLITDSRTLPWRAGVTGIAMGYAGFGGLKDYRGKPDIFGRKFAYSRVNVSDALATAAVLVMGEGDERQPLAVISQSGAEFCEKIHKKELHIDIRDDMYRPLLSKLPRIYR